MHTVHTTPGFIVNSRPYGEAGKMVSIFTRDFGLVTAIAQGIREEKSKLRYYVQDHSLGMYSLVRGKEFWRLTSAQEGNNYERSHSEKARELTGRLALLLRRLLHGEEANPELFDLISQVQHSILKDPLMDDARLNALESLTVLRMLRALGYVADVAELEPFMGMDEINPQLLDMAAKSCTLLNRHINNALKESQL